MMVAYAATPPGAAIDVARLREILAAIAAWHGKPDPIPAVVRMLTDRFGARFSRLDGWHVLRLGGLRCSSIEGERELVEFWVWHAHNRIEWAEAA